MSLSSHLQELRKKHESLSEEVELAQRTLSTDDLHITELLGGAPRSDVATYHVVGIGAPEEAAATAHRLQSEGHNRLQLKAGGRPIKDDITSILERHERYSKSARGVICSDVIEI